VAGAPSDAELVETFAAVAIDRDNQHFYRGWLDHELRVNRCADCGRWHHPPKPMCPACWSWNVVPTAVSGRGTVHLLMWLHHGPAPGGAAETAAPHPVVVVELAEQTGLRITSTIVGSPAESVRIGMPVEVAWIDRDGVPFPAFTPAATPAPERGA
jgi:uncharacterized OB-fold protein